MPLSEHDRKILWSNAGNRCSFRYLGKVCDQEVIITKNGEYTLIGRECHIFANSDKGPRGDASITVGDRDTYENMILLCANHHIIIDDKPSEFTPEVLGKMKGEHEKEIATKLQRNDYFTIEKSHMQIDAHNVDEAIGMEVNRPAKLKDVRVNLNAQNVSRVVGFSTNQGLRVVAGICECGKPFRFVSTGQNHGTVRCESCGKENPMQ